MVPVAHDLMATFCLCLMLFCCQIKAKEVQRIKNALTRDPATEQKLALLSRLPEVCCVLRRSFSGLCL